MNGVLRVNEHGTFNLFDYGDYVSIQVEGELCLNGNTYKPYHFHTIAASLEKRSVGHGLAKFQSSDDQVSLMRLGLELAESLTEDERKQMRLEVLKSRLEYACKTQAKALKKLKKAETQHNEAIKKTAEASQALNDFLKTLDNDTEA